MKLDGKAAVIYGGGGSIGGAVARAFAREGAAVFLAGRTREPLERVAASIRSAGGEASADEVDALDPDAVDRHLQAVLASAERIDIAFNVIGHGDVQGTPVVDMRWEDYVEPVATAVKTTFLTWRAAARHMIRQGSGVILAFGGEADPPRGAHLGSLQICFHAIEAMRRQFAVELGPHGVRLVTLRTSGIPETIPADFAGRDRITASIDASTLLGRAATLEDVGAVAAFAASDRARAITGNMIDISCGTFLS
jgi:NAD(P)-dependent dehydrogenase (short-subunit alcohol dehydrogenase family)